MKDDLLNIIKDGFSLSITAEESTGATIMSIIFKLHEKLYKRSTTIDFESTNILKLEEAFGSLVEDLLTAKIEMEATWPKITAETPIEEVQRIHRDIWNYVIKYGHKPDTPYIEDCACCEYACDIFRRSGYKRPTFRAHCDCCPIKSCLHLHSKYSKVATEEGGLSPHAIYYACKIRDLPFKKEDNDGDHTYEREFT